MEMDHIVFMHNGRSLKHDEFFKDLNITDDTVLHTILPIHGNRTKKYARYVTAPAFDFEGTMIWDGVSIHEGNLNDIIFDDDGEIIWDGVS